MEAMALEQNQFDHLKQNPVKIQSNQLNDRKKSKKNSFLFV